MDPRTVSVQNFSCSLVNSLGKEREEGEGEGEGEREEEEDHKASKSLSSPSQTSLLTIIVLRG